MRAVQLFGVGDLRLGRVLDPLTALPLNLEQIQSTTQELLHPQQTGLPKGLT